MSVNCNSCNYHSNGKCDWFAWHRKKESREIPLKVLSKGCEYHCDHPLLIDVLKLPIYEGLQKIYGDSKRIFADGYEDELPNIFRKQIQAIDIGVTQNGTKTRHRKICRCC